MTNCPDCRDRHQVVATRPHCANPQCTWIVCPVCYSYGNPNSTHWRGNPPRWHGNPKGAHWHGDGRP